MTPVRVLITNLCLNGWSGTEIYARDLALELKRRGHRPAVYSPAPGAIAEELALAGIPVVDAIDEVPEVPDVIHRHHRDETMAAVLAFPGVPALFVCHDANAWHDKAPLHPRILRYCAVSEVQWERLISDGVPRERTCLLLNFVDLDRFKPRSPLPTRARRALVYGNEAPWGAYLAPLIQACAELGIRLDGAGSVVGTSVANPESILGRYDIVFAKGKSALEAAAVGAAVVVYGPKGVGPMLTSSGLPSLRRLNFGIRLMTEPHSVDTLKERIRQYDPAESALVQAAVREHAGLPQAVDAVLAIYDELIRATGSWGSDLALEEERALAVYLPTFLSRTRQRGALVETALAACSQRVASAERPPWQLLRSMVGRLPVVGPALRAARKRLSPRDTPVVGLSLSSRLVRSHLRNAQS